MLFFYAKKQKMSECFFSHTPTFIVEPFGLFVKCWGVTGRFFLIFNGRFTENSITKKRRLQGVFSRKCR